MPQLVICGTLAAPSLHALHEESRQSSGLSLSSEMTSDTNPFIMVYIIYDDAM